MARAVAAECCQDMNAALREMPMVRATTEKNQILRKIAALKRMRRNMIHTASKIAMRIETSVVSGVVSVGRSRP